MHRASAHTLRPLTTPANDPRWATVRQDIRDEEPATGAPPATAFGTRSRAHLGGNGPPLGKPERVRPHSNEDLPSVRNPVRAVLGAQFRGRARDPLTQMMAPYSCPNCAALNSKLHRSKTETGECRVRIDELAAEAAGHSDRVRELEGALLSLRDELSARGRLLQEAKRAEASAREELVLERQRQATPSSAAAAAALREAEMEVMLHKAQQAEHAMREKVEAAEASEARSRHEVLLLVEAMSAAEAEAAHERALGRERDAASGQAAAAERAARERASAAEAACSAQVAAARADMHAATLAAEAQKLEAQRQCEKLASELEGLRSELGGRLQAAETARDRLQLAHDSLEAHVAELLRARDELARESDSQRLRTSKLASAVARAQEAEGERARAEEALRRELDEAKADATAAREGAAELRKELEAAREAARVAQKQAERAPAETMASMRELLSAVKIAVLAPCLKLHINGGDPLHVGSAGQVDFSSLGSMLEENVLKRFSQVSLLDSETPLATGAGGAHAIFPELKETMASVQEEVRDRLVAMMHNAGD